MNARQTKTLGTRGKDRPRKDMALAHEQAILDSLKAHIAVLDASGNIALVNRAWQKFSRENRCFWVEQTGPGVNYPGLCRRMGQRARQLRDGVNEVLSGRSKSFACDLMCAGRGKERWYHLSVTRLASRNEGAVISCTEVTDQKAGAAAKARLAAIVESSGDAITATDAGGTILDWNKGAQRLYGYSPVEAVGKPIDIIIPASRRAELNAVLEQVRSGRHPAPLVTMRRHKNGTMIPVTVNISPVRDTKGEIVAMSGIARDLSERRRLESEVLHAAEREQRRIAQDLHDGLTQQIAGVACLASVLQQRLHAEGSTHELEAGRIARLLNDASEQSRDLSRGLYPVRPQPRGLMAALDALAARTAELYGVQCQFICHHAVPVKDVATANHLYRIAQEAVANVIRHARASRIEIHLSKTPDQLLLGVADDGIGIRMKPRARKGIGLRIMNYRAELISGTLVVQNRAEGGTEVVCTVNRR